MGNHEQWMLRSVQNPCCHSWLVGMEAFETIQSYSPQAASILQQALGEGGIDLILKKLPLPYHVFVDSLPARHLQFFTDLQLFQRTPDVLCASIRWECVDDVIVFDEGSLHQDPCFFFDYLPPIQKRTYRLAKTRQSYAPGNHLTSLRSWRYLRWWLAPSL